MAPRTSTTAALLLCAALLPAIATAQSQLTPNTLKLNDPGARPRATLADLRLLVGHWQGEFMGGMAEEVWLPAAGGSMLGVYRLYKGNKVILYEIMIATEEEGSLVMKLKHFHADLKGWEEKDETTAFRFVKAAGNTAWFDGLTYRKQADGTLQGFLATRHGDDPVEEQAFTYRPVKGKR